MWDDIRNETAYYGYHSDLNAYTNYYRVLYDKFRTQESVKCNNICTRIQSWIRMCLRVRDYVCAQMKKMKRICDQLLERKQKIYKHNMMRNNARLRAMPLLTQMFLAECAREKARLRRKKIPVASPVTSRVPYAGKVVQSLRNLFQRVQPQQNDIDDIPYASKVP